MNRKGIERTIHDRQGGEGGQGTTEPPRRYRKLTHYNSMYFYKYFRPTEERTNEPESK